MSKSFKLIEKLYSCPCGIAGWKQFEDICLEILCYLFVPPLSNPIIKQRTYSGIDIRDAVFPNHNYTSNNHWANLLEELNARLVLFEFKNYDSSKIGKEEVNQARNYLTKRMGRLAILCCSKKPNKSAHTQRNKILNEEDKVILFMTKDDLKEMLLIKERDEDPADLIMDMVDQFYLQQE